MQDDSRLDDTDRPDWLEPVRRRIAGWLAGGLGSGWLVAVSGGCDSVGLLLALHRLAPSLGLKLTVAHLNHNLRGEEAREDARFVERLGESLGLPVVVGQWRPTRPAHFEADARAGRYAWLLETAGVLGASAVAVGHTRDDQAETVLHRLLRGTGPRGLAGIPFTRPLGPDRSVTLVRPLLNVSRRDVRDELDRIGQAFRDDPTNQDPSYTRARIRNDLLPKLEAEYNPRIAEALARLGQLAAANQEMVDALLHDLQTRIVRTIDPRQIRLDLDATAALSPHLIAEVVRRAWRTAQWPEQGMTARRWSRIAALIAEGHPTRVHVGEGVELYIHADIHLTREPAPDAPPPPFAPVVLKTPGAVEVPWAGVRLEAHIIADETSTYDEVVDLDRVVFPLTIRPPLPGDRFDPLGMSGRRVALRDLLRNRRVPPNERRFVPLVADETGILWIVGHRIADRARVTETTIRRLGLRWVGNL